MRRESLKTAVHLAKTLERRGMWQLLGCMDGGWPETMQAISRIREALPPTRMRSYTASELIDELYRVDPVSRRYVER